MVYRGLGVRRIFFLCKENCRVWSFCLTFRHVSNLYIILDLKELGIYEGIKNKNSDSAAALGKSFLIDWF